MIHRENDGLILLKVSIHQAQPGEVTDRLGFVTRGLCEQNTKGVKDEQARS